MDAALRLQPHLCFERCNLGFKEAPINIKRKGVLHSSWAKLTQSVRVLQVAEEGMYMNTNLERVCLTRYVTFKTKLEPGLQPSYHNGKHSWGISISLRRPDASFHNCGELQRTSVPVPRGREGHGTMLFGTLLIVGSPFISTT